MRDDRPFDQRTEFRWSRSGSSAPAPRACRRRRTPPSSASPHVLLEAEDHPSNTIYKYQKGKHVMAEPQILPLRSPHAVRRPASARRCWSAGTEELEQHKVNIRYGCEVTAIARRGRRFRGEDQGGRDVLLPQARCSPSACRATCASSACRARTSSACSTSSTTRTSTRTRPSSWWARATRRSRTRSRSREQNRVILINRNEEFARCKEGNLALVLSAIKDGRIECRYGTSRRQGRGDRKATLPLRLLREDARGPDVIECHRIIARLGAIPPRKLVEGFGVKFPSADPARRAAALGHLRVEREGPVHHRRAGRLPAHQAGDEPGLRGGRVRARAHDRAGRRAAAGGEVRQLLAQQIGVAGARR